MHDKTSYDFSLNKPTHKVISTEKKISSTNHFYQDCYYDEPVKECKNNELSRNVSERPHTI